MRNLIWIISAIVIVTLACLGGCQSAGVENVQIAEKGKLVLDSDQTANSTWALILIPLGCVFLFLLYLYLDKEYLRFGRK